MLCCQVLSQTADFHQFSWFPSSKRSPRHSLLDIVSFPTVFRRRRDRLSFSRLPSIIFPRSVPSCRLFQSILLPANQARAAPSFFGTFFSSDSISSALDHIIILKAPRCEVSKICPEPQTLPAVLFSAPLARAAPSFCGDLFFRLCFVGAGSHYHSKGSPVLVFQDLSRAAYFA